MLVIPAVDIMDGKCVRLVRGDPKKLKVYYDNPLEPAKFFESQGAEILHLIDLDAALGLGRNFEIIEFLSKNLCLNLQIGGGIRTLERAETLINLGASRIIFGTAAIQNPKLIEEAVHRFGSSKIAAAIDEKNNKVTFHGWKDNSEIYYIDLAHLLETIGVTMLIFTSVNVDGTLKGPNFKKIFKLIRNVNIPVIVSGGIGSLKELKTLATMGVNGVIIGTAFYEKKFTFKQALEAINRVS
jgi:phosphoribosylformimino-5-aminoimidazole carboxamide ribotide isomerase